MVQGHYHALATLGPALDLWHAMADDPLHFTH